MCVSYLAANIGLGYMSNILAFENQSKLEVFLLGLGNFNCYSFLFIIGCILIDQGADKKLINCKESLPMLKKAPLKVKLAVK